MAKTVFRAEMDKWPEEQTIKTHNRWHPDIPDRREVQARATSFGSSATTGPAARSRTTNPPTTSATSTCPRCTI